MAIGEFSSLGPMTSTPVISEGLLALLSTGLLALNLIILPYIFKTLLDPSTIGEVSAARDLPLAVLEFLPVLCSRLTLDRSPESIDMSALITCISVLILLGKNGVGLNYDTLLVTVAKSFSVRFIFFFSD